MSLALNLIKSIKHEININFVNCITAITLSCTCSLALKFNKPINLNYCSVKSINFMAIIRVSGPLFSLALKLISLIKRIKRILRQLILLVQMA